MKALIYDHYGPPEIMQVKELEKPVPKDNEILIKVYATTVTSGDARMRRADPFLVRLFNGFFKPKSKILGSEFSGEVESIGKNVKKFKKGDLVFGGTDLDLGASAEYIALPETGTIALKPENISFEEAGAVSFGGNTALHFLKKANIQHGQKILIYGASGSIGTAAVQLAKHFGAVVTAVCSSKNTELVTCLGADKVLDYTAEDFSLSGEIYDIIFDTVGKSPFLDCVNSLTKNGVFLRAVHMAPTSILLGLWTTLTRNIKIVSGVATETQENIDFLKNLLETGQFKSVIDKRFSYEQIVNAHRYVDTGHKKGNVVITFDHKNQ
jgi:NADPH:quinone reductase-like Zn-dependent oxidoreductase